MTVRKLIIALAAMAGLLVGGAVPTAASAQQDVASGDFVTNTYPECPGGWAC